MLTPSRRPALFNRVLRTGLALGLVALALPVANTIAERTASAVPPPACGSSGTPNVVALADPNFYIDSGAGATATYAGYTVRTGSTAANQVWMELSNFTGGVVSLAPGQSPNSALPNITANSQTTAYFLLQAPAATTTPQTHTITLFNGNPSLNSVLCQRTYTYNVVYETIKALANKVNSVTVPPMAEATVGDLVTVTVQGATGILGAGPSIDPGVLSYAPNAAASFPSDAWRLERTELDISPDGVAPQQTYVNRLYLSGASGPNRNYTARYSFRALAPRATGSAIRPIQYIASGTQVKHTDIASSAYGSLPAISSTANIQITKSAAPDTLTSAGGTVSYTVSIRNYGGTAGTVDRIEDTIPVGASYVAGSSELNSRTIADPAATGSVREWQGPISVPAGGVSTLTYDLVIPASAGTHTNSVVGWFGSSQFDSTRDLTASAPATASVTVAQAPGPVTAVDDSASTNARQPVTIDVLANDTSGNGQTLSISSVGTPSNGTAVISNGAVIYTPADGFAGTETFTYQVTDGNNTATATVTVTVSPIARNDIYVTAKSTTLSGTSVMANDDCTSCTVSLVTNVTSGTLTLNSNGTFSYTAPNNNGSTTFTYRVTTPSNATATAVATIYINGAGPDLATTPYDTNAAINVIANDTCAGGASLTANTAPTNGTVSYSGSTATYNPNTGFWGLDSFTYKCSGNNTATVTVLVAPPATTKQTTFNTAVSGDVTQTSFFSSITTIACAGCTYAITGAPSNGTATLNSSTGAFSYAPESSFAGSDTLTYSVTDPATGLVVTTTVVIRTGPRAANDSVTMLARNTTNIAPLTNDQCPTTCTVSITQQPSTGTLTANGNGTFSYDTAPEHEIGAVTFTYQVESSVASGVTDTATVTITVEGAVDDTATASPGTPLTINAKANDPCTECGITKTSDPLVGTVVLEANGTFTYTAPATFSGRETFTYTRTKNGRSTTATVTVTVNPDAVNDAFSVISGSNPLDVLLNDVCDTCVITAIGALSAGGSAQISSSGYEVSYTPSISSGSETFTYTIEDALGSTATATVTVTILTPPGASNDTATTDAGTPVVINVTSNDACANCTVEIAADPTSGTVVVLADGSIRFTPAAGFSGSATFSYIVTDSNGLTATATVTLTVRPTAENDSSATTLETPVTVETSQNDDCTSCTLTVRTQPANGTTAVTGTSVQYTPAIGFEGTDTIDYRVTDPVTGEHADATITIVVSNATADASATPFNTAVTTSVLTNDACNGCTASVNTQPSNGSVVSDGTTITYTPDEGFWGIDTYTYTASDGTVSSNATVRILVGPPARSTTVETNTTGSGSLTVAACAGCTFEVITTTTDGDLSVAENGAWEYTPTTNFSGNDTFIYRVTDPVSGLTRTGSFSITVSISRITVTVNVTNDDGGTAVPADFTPTVNGSTVTSGATNTYSSGAQYTIAQTLVPNYANTSLSCADADTSAVVANPFTLQPGQHVSCVIVNNDLSTNPAVSIDLTASIVDVDNDNRNDKNDRIDYTYTITNTGAVTLTSGTVSDTRGLSISCPSGSATYASLAPGAQIVCTASSTVTQAQVDSGEVQNTASTSASSASGAVSDSHAVTTTLVRVSDVSLQKVFSSHTDSNSNSRIDAGETFEYTITATNTGNTTLTNVDIEDALTNDVTTCATVLPDATCVLTAIHTVTQADIDAGSVSNNATVEATAPDGQESDADSNTKTISQQPGLSLAKTAGAIQDTNNSALHDAGDTVSYSYTVTNTGNVTLTNIAVTDDLIAVISCDADNVVDTLAPGADVTCTGEYILTQADIDAGSVTNNAEAASGATSATDAVTKNITRVSQLSVTKTFTAHTDSNANSRIDAGESFTYNITATNTGNTTLTSVSVTDDLTNDTASCATVLPGATCDLTALYIVTQADIDAGSVANNGTANATAPDGPASGTDANTKPVTRDNAISLANTYVGLQDVNLDGTAQVGESGRFSLVATNTGNTTLTNVVITDTVSGATHTCATLAPGATCDLTSDVTIDQAALDANEVSSSGTVSADTPQGGTVTDTDPASGALTGTPSIALSKTATGTADTNTTGRLDAGDTVSYAIVATNDGTISLSNVVINDALTNDTKTCATLAPAATCELTTDYVLTQVDIDAGSVTNTATVEAAAGSQTINGNDSHTEPLTRTSSIALQKVFSSHTDSNSNSRIDAGETFEYTITATNTGNTTLTSVSVTDDLTGDSGSCATLAPAATCEITATYILTQADVDAGSVTNNATVEATAPDGPVSDSATNTKAVAQTPSLSLDKAAGAIQDTNNSALHDAGDTVSYSYTVTNTGNTTLQNIAVTDDLIAVISCDADNVVDTLAPGADVTCTGEYILTQADIDAGSVTNNAEAVSGATSATDAVTKNITRVSQLAVSKVFSSHTDSNSNSRIDAGESFTYNITATNTGNTTLTSVSVTDDLTGDTSTCQTLAPTATCDLTATYIVTQVDIDAGSVTNNATANASAPDGPVSGTDANTKPVTRDNAVQLSTTWVGLLDTDNDGSPDLGEFGRFSLVATNTGNTTLVNVVVTDTVSGATHTCATLAPGATCTLTSGVTIDQAALDANEVTSQGAVTADTPQGGTVTDTDPASGALTGTPSIALTKTATGVIDSNSSNRVDAGDTVRYLVTATNDGTITLTQVTISDALTGDSTTCASLAPAGLCSLVTDYVLTQADIDAGSVANTATVEAGAGSQTITDDASHTETLTLAPAALVGSKQPTSTTDTDNSNDVTVGDTLNYTLTATNTGVKTLRNVVVTDELTGDSTTCATLAPAGTCVLSVSYVVLPQDGASGSVANTGSFAADGGVSDSDTVTTPVNYDPLVSITAALDNVDNTQVAPTDRTDAGDAGTWRYVITNTGNVALSDLEFTTPVSDAPSCASSLATLAPGASVTCTAQRTITQSLLDASSVPASGRVTALHRQAAPRIEANAPLTTPLVAAASLAVQKAVVAMPGTCDEATTSAAIIEGDEARWCFTLRNSGNVTLTDITLLDQAINITANEQPTGVPASLAPNASITVSKVVKHTASVTNTASATARHGATQVQAATASASLTAAPSFSITGVVWFDANRDGARNEKEPYLENITVELQPRSTARAQGVKAQTVRTQAATVLQSKITAADGRYLFTRVPPGEYKVVARLSLAGFKPLNDADGNSDWEVGATVVNAPIQADFASTGAATLAGTAFKRAGGVVSNAKLSCRWEGFDKKLLTDDDVVFEAVANEKGEYSIEGAPFGELSCAATDPVTKAVETFDAKITEPGRVVKDTEFGAPSKSIPTTGSNTTGVLVFGVLSVFLGALLVLLRRRLAARPS